MRDMAHPPHPLLVQLQAEVDAKCRRCGQCCRKSKPVSVRDREVWLIARFLRTPSAKVRKLFFGRGKDRQIVMKDPCPFLMEKGCMIYEVRPRSCRDFPFLSDVSQASFARTGTVILTEYCPASQEVVAKLRQRLKAEIGRDVPEMRSAVVATSVEEELAAIEASQRDRE